MQNWGLYLEKAKQCSRTAEIAAAKRLNNCAANRAYYCAYLAELAALQRFDPIVLPATGWQHYTVVHAFNHRLITNKKMFKPEMIANVSYLESLRIKGDYQQAHVTGTESKESVRTARKILEIISDKITQGE